MDMIRRQHPAYDLDAFLTAHLAADVAHAKADIAGQYFVSVLGRPHEMIAMVENAVATSGILHVDSL